MAELQPITLPDLPEPYYWEIATIKGSSYVYVRLCKTRTAWEKWKYYTDEEDYKLVNIEGYVVTQAHLTEILEKAVEILDRQNRASLHDQLKGAIKNATFKELKK